MSYQIFERGKRVGKSGYLNKRWQKEYFFSQRMKPMRAGNLYCLQSSYFFMTIGIYEKLNL